MSIYLPMIPEIVYTMLACARIGAVHCVVFAGFSSDSLRDRILDGATKVGAGGVEYEWAVDSFAELQWWC